MQYDIAHADVLSWAGAYDGPLFHAAFMDAPYEMEFMGKGWDDSGVSFQVETWDAIARHLHPGAFLFVFAGTINDDLISVAMRRAGLRKYHRSGAWVYGSGFPKAARIDTVLDRRAGATRSSVGTRKHQPKFAAAELGYRQKDNGYNSKARATFDVTAPATEMAADWQGHRYGGQMLKPALESLLIFQKPVVGDMVTSITRTGAGAVNVDAGRIGGPTDTRRVKGTGATAFPHSDDAWVSHIEYGGQDAMGRWPANFSLSHHPDCNGTCAPGCPVAALGAQSGESSSGGGAGYRNHPDSPTKIQNSAPGYVDGIPPDFGTAARFFFNADWTAERLEAAELVGYYAKASSTEREAGLDDLQARLMRELYFDDDTIDDGRPTPIDNPYQRGKTERKNIHPTIKPIALNRWIASLLLPPERYAPRRLLVPFAGAGSEMIGAMLAGWDVVQGVELMENHVQIARARLAFWQQMRYKLMNPDAPVKVTAAKPPNGQSTLW